MSAAERIAENLAAIRQRIEQAAARSGRSASEIRLVAVTKYVDASISALVVGAGCRDLGESRPQQLWEKATHEELRSARWHMIGHLQRNKVRRTLPLVELIHSVDSLRLATAINDEAVQLGHPAHVLLEVNCSGDQAKHGLSPQGSILDHLAMAMSHDVEVAIREGATIVRVGSLLFEGLR